MSPTLLLNGIVTQDDVRGAKTALDTVRETADAATAKFKEATDKLAKAQALQTDALVELVVAGYIVENLERGIEAQKAYDDAKKAVTLATNNLSAAKMDDTKADRDYKEALNVYSTRWYAWYVRSAIGDLARGIKNTVTFGNESIKNHVTAGNEVVKQSVADGNDGVKTLVNQSNYEHHANSIKILGKQINAVGQAVKGPGSLPPNSLNV